MIRDIDLITIPTERLSRFKELTLNLLKPKKELSLIYRAQALNNLAKYIDKKSNAEYQMLVFLTEDNFTRITNKSAILLLKLNKILTQRAN